MHLISVRSANQVPWAWVQPSAVGYMVGQTLLRLLWQLADRPRQCLLKDPSGYGAAKASEYLAGSTSSAGRRDDAEIPAGRGRHDIDTVQDG
jgi:hypothetical protein